MICHVHGAVHWGGCPECNIIESENNIIESENMIEGSMPKVRIVHRPMLHRKDKLGLGNRSIEPLQKLRISLKVFTWFRAVRLETHVYCIAGTESNMRLDHLVVLERIGIGSDGAAPIIAGGRPGEPLPSTIDIPDGRTFHPGEIVEVDLLSVESRRTLIVQGFLEVLTAV